MSLLSCAAARSNLCMLQALELKETDRMKHFCLKCGLRKHGPCGVEYSVMLANEAAHKDVLNIIAPEDKDHKYVGYVKCKY
eukprot:scaffold43489_cov329-Skeletonema_marinoi.AAC.1